MIMAILPIWAARRSNTQQDPLFQTKRLEGLTSLALGANQPAGAFDSRAVPLKTAKALSLEVPLQLQQLADEVIE